MFEEAREKVLALLFKSIKKNVKCGVFWELNLIPFKSPGWVTNALFYVSGYERVEEKARVRVECVVFSSVYAALFDKISHLSGI